MLHPSDPLFNAEQYNFWTRNQCAIARTERTTLTLVVAVPALATAALDVCGLLFQRR